VEKRSRDLLQVLDSLRVFACAIAILGVINFLSAAVLDRRREISLLRSIGVTRSQIRRAVVIEAGLIGLAGAGLGILEGFPASFFMVTHSLRVAMNWSIDFTFPISLAASTVAAITLAAAAAGYIPARRITTGTILAGLETE
jgi:putative ABC transport system permease protein